MKILITGAGGMLGTELSHVFSSQVETIGLGRSDRQLPIRYISCDLTDENAVSTILLKEKPDWIFHTAAMTQVDLCETEREKALLQNVQVTESLVRLANQLQSYLVFFSTDYVFDGEKSSSYKEGDPAKPVNFYGETKLLAENYIQSCCKRFAIFRVSWLFGIHGYSFPEMVLSLASKQKELSIVSDQFGRPTHAKDVASTMGELLLRSPNPLELHSNQVFHLGNQNMTSWFEYAKLILKLSGKADVSLRPIASNDLHRSAVRPNASILNLEKVKEKLEIELQPWEKALRNYLQEFHKKKGVLFS
ncbi:MAG: dTDP-4-dehydrorhamnose reductase [Candidatus Omnitrophica bacterium]|nr:dTDP-4-dehydrorhamnose reductase [Candidatus Omnitrophota bacterium]